jgi:C_GCAxxG_C_C family probable redox protein
MYALKSEESAVQTINNNNEGNVFMNEIKEKAIRIFSSGYNCAQAVVSAYSEKMNFDEQLALGLSCGFGAGMGRMQETCGAVTGAFMVIGLNRYRKFTDPVEQKEHAYLLIREFNSRFLEQYKTNNCKQLLNCDLLSEEGRQFFKDNNLHETVCQKCIVDSIRILDEIL